MRNRQSWKATMFFLIMLFSTSFVSAGTVGNFTYIEGRVDVFKAGAETATPAVVDENISAGDILRTKGLSKAEITFQDGSILRLAPNSVVKIEKYLLDDKGRRRKGDISLARGKIRMIVTRSRTSSPFIINTPNASGKTKGSDIFVFYQIQSTGMLMVKGNLSLTGANFPGEAINLPAGTTAIVPWDKKPAPPRFYFDVERKRFETETSPTKRTILAKRAPKKKKKKEDIFGYTPAESTAYAETVAIGGPGDNRRIPNAAKEPFSRPFILSNTSGGSGPGGSITSAPILFSSNLEGFFSDIFSGILNGSIAAGADSGPFTLNNAVYTGSETTWLLHTINGTSNDGGSFYGWMAGNWPPATWNSFFAGLYVDGNGIAGYLTGNLSGTHASPMSGGGILTLGPVGPITLADTVTNSLSEPSIFSGAGNGNFEIDNGGIIKALNIESATIGIENQSWGIWRAKYEGSYAPLISAWTLAAGSSTAGGEESWLGTIKGTADTDWAAGKLSGTFRGYRMRAVGTGIAISTMSGNVLGTYEDTTWQAAGAGTWVEITTLDAAALGYDNIGGLDNFVSIPVSETYSSLLTGAGAFAAGGSIEGTMDTTFFTNEFLSHFSGAWASLIEGTHTGPTGNNWSLNMSKGGDTVTITGAQWSGGKWIGAVTGSTGGNINFKGAAGGTYDAGNFSGVGSGTWKIPTPGVTF
ncbi:MAG: FecR domain-containing protein [Nitrospirae bacterium]|nr:FecR domain-containing protein [Nitrospirota bacterium]